MKRARSNSQTAALVNDWKRQKLAIPSARWGRAPGGQAGGRSITRMVSWSRFGDITVAAGATALAGLTFAFNGLANTADLAAVYDEFRIDKVQISFMPFVNQVPATTLAVAASPMMDFIYTAKDYNDITAPASSAFVLAYQTCKITHASMPHIRSLKPVPVTGDIMQNGSWIPTTAAGIAVPHYGIKYAIIGSPGVAITKYAVFVKYFLSLRNVQ